MQERKLDEKIINKAIEKMQGLTTYLTDELKNGDEFDKLMAFTRITNIMLVEDKLDSILKLGMRTGIAAQALAKQEDSSECCKSWLTTNQFDHPMYLDEEKEKMYKKMNPLEELLSALSELSNK